MKPADQNGRLYASHLVEAAERFNSREYRAGGVRKDAERIAALFDGSADYIADDIRLMARAIRKGERA